MAVVFRHVNVSVIRPRQETPFLVEGQGLDVLLRQADVDRLPALTTIGRSKQSLVGAGQQNPLGVADQDTYRRLGQADRRRRPVCLRLIFGIRFSGAIDTPGCITKERGLLAQDKELRVAERPPSRRSLWLIPGHQGVAPLRKRLDRF